jgi:hypothetical protein
MKPVPASASWHDERRLLDDDQRSRGQTEQGLGGRLLAFDAVYQYIVKISDVLSDGTIEGFPQEFASKSTPTH